MFFESSFVDSFAVVSVNGRFRTASSFVLSSPRTVSIASGFRFAFVMFVPISSRCAFFDKFAKTSSNLTSDRTSSIPFAVHTRYLVWTRSFGSVYTSPNAFVTTEIATWDIGVFVTVRAIRIVCALFNGVSLVSLSFRGLPVLSSRSFSLSFGYLRGRRASWRDTIVIVPPQFNLIVWFRH